MRTIPGAGGSSEVASASLLLFPLPRFVPLPLSVALSSEEAILPLSAQSELVRPPQCTHSQVGDIALCWDSSQMPCSEILQKVRTPRGLPGFSRANVLYPKMEQLVKVIIELAERCPGGPGVKF